ncbi:uroporphyrinogen-III synthase [Roseospira visakhapatnamensis]|uniref:Uroporphyrinogen-III synthase n=1 Tax=Roseospira visakhapatnamensis TaxID=390880 RepID=A0A7W6REP1_9PROT|nr:uroporphyrinogen-III synthase [Roseospira visakhapatnamensis]MBB4267161.1 uroporphyrinogen-III synthase [Roseospira visakhapatnamensis]
MRVLVTRPKEDAERLAMPLRAMGATVVNEPMLVIMPMAGPNVDLTGAQAVLLTSANGARALAMAIDRRDVPVYAVGDQTARVARAQGFATVHSAGGDVETLADLVARDLDPAHGTLLHAAGSTRAGDLAGVLGDRGFTVQVVRLYDARPTAALSKDLRDALTAGQIDAAVFFSPRTAKIFAEHVRGADLADALRGMTAYALSPAVARALSGLPLAQVRVAETPAQDAVLTLIQADVRDGRLVADAQPMTPLDAAPADARENDGVDEDAEDAEGEDARHGDDPDGDDPDGDDRTHDDGEAAYGGSADGEDPHDRVDDADDTEPVEHRAVRAVVVWGLALVLLVAGIVVTMPWWKPLLPPPYQALLPTFPQAPDSAAVANLRSRLDTLTADLATLRVSADETTAAALAEARLSLSARLDALEGHPSAAYPDVDVDIALADALASVAGRISTLSADTATLRAEVAALTARVETLSEVIPRTDPRAVALLIEISLLRERVKNGQRFADALKPLTTAPILDTDHDSALAVLSAHANTGVATLAALRHGFEAMSVDAARTVDSPDGESRAVWETTLASILSSETERRTDDTPMDGTLGTLFQAAVHIADNKLADAVTTLGALQGPAAAAAADWMADAHAHLAVDAALASLSSAALAGIGGAQTTE